jgi:hypothetical protein
MILAHQEPLLPADGALAVLPIPHGPKLPEGELIGSHIIGVEFPILDTSWTAV